MIEIFDNKILERKDTVLLYEQQTNRWVVSFTCMDSSYESHKVEIHTQNLDCNLDVYSFLPDGTITLYDEDNARYVITEELEFIKTVGDDVKVFHSKKLELW